jgi:PBSX family phage terminase large subunit
VNLNNLPLSDKQLRSIAQSERHRLSIWSGAVRSGKTIASLVAFLIALAAAPSSGLIVIVGRSLQTIERNILEPMQDPALFGPLAKHVHHTRGATTAVILGRTVHLIGASDARAEGRIRGATVCLAMADEITLLPEGFFNQLLARLSVPGARLIGTTNPDSPAHWLRRNFLLREGELDLGAWQFTLDDNPSLAPAYVEALKAEYVGLWYRRFILGEWCAAEGAIFDMWDPDLHVADILPPIRSWLCAAIDYGTTNPLHCVLLGIGTDSCLYAVSEWRYDSRQSRRQMTDSEYTQRIRTWLQEVPVPASRRADGSWLRGVQPHYIVVDPSAASLRTQLHREGLNPVAGNNAVLDGIRTVSSLFAANRLKVSRDCPQLIAEVPGYSWDDQAAAKGEDKPIKVADHGVDALRYAVMTTRSMWQHEIQLATAA